MDEELASVTTYRHVACTRCGCVCDDLSVTVGRDGGISSVTPDCHLADEFFRTLRRPLPELPALIHGKHASFESSVARAAEILTSSRAPLFFGLSRSSTDGQRAACELADLVSGTVDTTASIGHGASIMALQAAGESTSTLGEVRHRSDLIIYWCSDPMVSHPRHMERFVHATGLDTPHGRSDRHVVFVNSRGDVNSDPADSVLTPDEGGDFEVLWTLRALVKGLKVDRTRVAGIELHRLEELAHRMKTCHYGAVFFGVQLTEGGVGHANVEALLRLVTDLNLHTRFVARRMRIPGDVTGADSVLCWQTGYPFSVSLNRGYPRYNPGEFSAGPMLSRGDADCAVLIGAERLEKFSDEARAFLRSIPVIHLDPPGCDFGVEATVRFHTAIDGIHRCGTVYRMDEVPVPLKQVVPSTLPSDEEVLKAITRDVRNLR